MFHTQPFPADLPARSRERGFVRLTPNRRYFQFEDGTPFVPIGHCHFNLRRVTEEGLMAARLSGETIIRIWPDDDETGEFPDEDMDRLLELAAQYDLYIIASIIHTNRMTDLYHGPSRFDAGKTIWNQVCTRSEQVLTDPAALDLAAARIKHVAHRWGGHPHIFAWEIVNEIDVLYRAEPGALSAYIDRMGALLHTCELERWGQTHLRTVSTYELLPAHECFYTSRHVDFLSFHPYVQSVLQPLNGLDAALNLNRAIRLILARTSEPRPYLNTEYGPILQFFEPAYACVPEPVHDEWVHNLIWAHTASGGAGAGITIPVAYGYGQRLTPAQNRSQHALMRFSAHIDWTSFASVNADGDVAPDRSDVAVMACRDGDRLAGWLLRDTRTQDMLAAIDRIRCGPPANGADLTRKERLLLARTRLFALDAWGQLLRQAGLDPQSQYTRRVIGLLLNRSNQRGGERCLVQAAHKIEDSLTLLAWLSETDPRAQALWATGRAIGDIRTRLCFTGFSGCPLRVTWFDDRTGRVLWWEKAAGTTFEIETPCFDRHLALIVEPLTSDMASGNEKE
jgi:mannan endo-1,4-beta-mannosidase